MSKIWFTSDLHLYHDREFIYKVRGYKSAAAHLDGVILKINEYVMPDDELYILGDVAFGGDTDAAVRAVSRINGKKHLVIGNHDTDKKLEAYREAGVFESIEWAGRIRVNKSTRLYLSHYPTLVSNHEDRTPIFNLHGHTHQDLIFNEDFEKTNIHIGWDTWQRPVEMEKIEKLIEKVRGR